MCAGTHDITLCSASQEHNGIVITVSFTEHSQATGALLNFIFIHESGNIDLNKSFCQAVDRSDVSDGLMLPLDLLHPGQYVAYAYDIERNGRVMNGIRYPASNCSFRVMDGQGISDCVHDVRLS